MRLRQIPQPTRRGVNPVREQAGDEPGMQEPLGEPGAERRDARVERLALYTPQFDESTRR